jgi:hypothetical protein
VGKVMPSRWVGYKRMSRNCQQCGEAFFIPPRRKYIAKYCSRKCQGLSRRTSERRIIACERCGTKFETLQDHGVWPRFCSNDCFRGDAIKAAPKECASCGAVFMASAARHDGVDDDGRRKYCSDKCRHEGAKNGEEVPCVNCGKLFYVTAATANRQCCSWGCRNEYYTESRSHSWNGGKYESVAGDVRVRVDPTKLGGSAYMGEHRIVAARWIGRKLERHEPVLHINRVKTDNRPENLFVCGTITEMQQRLRGRLPFPEKSNLRTYR